MRLLLPAFLFFSIAAARAQPVGTCAHGTALGFIEGAEVRAGIPNTGALFYNDSLSARYLVPKATGRTPIFSANLWVGGKVEGELRVTAATYENFEFWPGPLDEAGNPPTDCSAYDRVWVVSRADIEDYYRTGEPAPDLRDWPAALGAPVLDGDGVEGNYDLEGGDQPAVWGDETAWWVMNDLGNVHENTESSPLGIEVRGTAFAVIARPILGQTTFYRYEITNRGNAPIDSAYVAFYVDADLGDFADDYRGSDTTLAMAYTYNADDDDYVYGVPPAVGMAVLQGPVGLPNGRDDDGDGATDEAGERLTMTASPCVWKGFAYPGPYPAPRDAQEHYYRMQGLMNDGTLMREGAFGAGDGPPTRFCYPGDPVMDQFWSEVNPLPGEPANSPSDRWMVLSTGPFRLEPGQTEEVVFAIPFAQGVSNMSSVLGLRAVARIAHNAWAGGLLAPSRVEAPPPVPPSDALLLSRPFPNPFTDAVTLRFSVPERMPVRLAVYDVLGREVAVLVDGEQEAGEQAVTLDGAALPSGLYLLVFEAAGERRTLTAVRTR
jgi:hypothetical protein